MIHMDRPNVIDRDGSNGGNGGMEFEAFPDRADVQLSRVLTTPKGDKIRAIVTTGGSIILTAVGRASGDTVVLSGDVFNSGESGTIMAKGFWDTVAEVAIGIGKDVIDGMIGGHGGGGGSKCESKTTVTADAKTGTTTVTITMVCSPA